MKIVYALMSLLALVALMCITTSCGRSDAQAQDTTATEKQVFADTAEAAPEPPKVERLVCYAPHGPLIVDNFVTNGEVNSHGTVAASLHPSGKVISITGPVTCVWTAQ